MEHLDGPLLGDLGHPLGELLALEGVHLAHPGEVLRGEGWDALEGEPPAPPAKGVPDGEDARVEQADDIPGVGLLHHLPLLGHQLLGLGQLHLFATLDVVHLHPLFEPAGADADKGDAVPVGLVHVGLYLKDKGGKIRGEGVDDPLVGPPGQGGGGHLEELLQEGLHPEVGKGRAEEHRGQLAVAHLVQVELVAGPVQQFDVVGQGLVQFLAQHLVQPGVPQGKLGGLHLLGVAGKAALLKGDDLLLPPVIDPLEGLAAADGPVHRVGADAQLLFDLLHQVKGVPGLPVHLVDKGEDGDVPHDADLEQLPGLGLHPLGGVDDHDGGIRRHQGAVGVLREILVAGGVQNIDAKAVVAELHGGGGHRDAPLLFDLHPVGDGVAGGLFALHRPGHGDGPAIEEEFLGEGGLARVGVGNDGEGPSPLYLLF